MTTDSAILKNSTLLRLWPVDELVELADGPTGCVTVARGGCLLAWNFVVIMSTVLTEAERTRPNLTVSHQCWLTPSLPFENSTGRKPCTALYWPCSILPLLNTGTALYWHCSLRQRHFVYQKATLTGLTLNLYLIYDMIWYDAIWYDTMRYDTIWYNMIWCDIWYDAI